MKIALFRELPINFNGGVTNVLYHILNHLKKNGHEAIVFAPDANKSARRFMGHRFVGVPSVTPGFFKKNHFHLPYSNDKNLDSIFTRFKPDLIHLLHPMALSWAAYTSAKNNKIPVLASYHTNYHIYAQFYPISFLSNALWNYTRWLFNKSNRVLSPSHTVKQMLVDGGIKQVDVWTRGVDSQLYSPNKRSEQIRNQLTNGHPEKTIFLFVGRLYKEKNIDFLAQCWEDKPNTVLVVTGKGPEEKEFKKQLAGKNVVFTGHKSGEELAAVYASSDVLLFPSVTEGYPNVVMEAMASGLPVIGANAFGVSDIIEESQAGLLFEPNAPAIFQRHIQNLHEDKELRKELSQRARKFGKSKSWETLMAELFTHYEELIEQSKQQRLDLLQSQAALIS